MTTPLRPTPHAPRLTLAVCLLVGALFWGAAAAAAQQTVTYQDYLARIGRWREQVRLVESQNGANCEQVLGAIADEMVNLTAVQMPNGTLMSVNHTGIVIALRAVPCDLARADSLLAGICPNQVCPVGIVPANGNEPTSDQDLPLISPSQPPGTPIANAEQQLEELLQESQPSGETDVSPGSTSEQDGINATPGSQGETAELGTGSPGVNETAAVGETSPDAGGGTTDGPETPGPSSTPSGVGETAAESGGEGGAGSGGEGEPSAADAAAGETVGNENTTGTTTDEGGSAATSNAEGSSGQEADDAAATAPALPPTSPPPQISPPVTRQTSPWVWAVVALALLIIVVGAILFILSQPGDDRERQRRSQEPETADEAVDEGRELIAAGNYRGAVRHLFLAALLTLDERNLIQYDKTRTNYEILSEAELRTTVVAALTPVVETFEKVWYGFETVGAADYERLAQQIELLKQA